MKETFVIRHLQYHQLDKERYDRCISEAQNGRVYAYSWYLDLVCDNWDALVWQDYEIVMPLPWKTRFGIPFIITPNWAQQLGLFSREEISVEMLTSFLKAIPRKFIKIDYRMNAGNRSELKSVSVRDNYLLVLDQPFERIVENFNNNRKKAARLCFDDYHIDKNTSADAFRQFFESIEKPFQLQKSAFNSLLALLESGRKEINIWSVQENKNIVAALFWVNDSRRLTCLLPIVSENRKKDQLPTFLICELIKSFENSKLILDFEGSMIPGVAQFYRSFGAEKEFYYVYKKRLFGHV